MSGNGSSSADPSIEVVEEKLNGMTGSKERDYRSYRWHSEHGKEHQYENKENDKSAGEEERHVLLSLPPRAESRGGRVTDVNISAIEKDEGGSDTSNATGQWQNDVIDAGSGHEKGSSENYGDIADDMAERILETLQRKDRLLEKQAHILKIKEMELENLRIELDGLHKEKEHLLLQLRGSNSGAAPVTTTEVAVNGEGRLADSSFLLQRADAQLQDERAERQQDAAYFKAHIDQLTAQLAREQRNASAREKKHVQDLEIIQREMSELSAHVDSVHLTKEALRRTQEQLAEAIEARTQCQLERDSVVRTLQDALRRDKLDSRRQLDAARSETQRWQAAAAAAEAKRREAEDESARAKEEARALRLEAEKMNAEHATLRLEAVGQLEQLRHLQEQRVAERAAAEVLRRQLEAAVSDAEQLRSLREVQSRLLVEESMRHEQFHAEVEVCVHGTQQLEEALTRCEQQRRGAEERERLLLDERDQLRTQLQQLTTASRQELLEQQQLAEEMRGFHQAKLQQLQQAVERQQQYAGRLVESNKAVRAECAALQTSLEHAREQFNGAVVELQQLRQQCATLELGLADAQRAQDEYGARERQSAEQLETMRKQLRLCERAKRELKAQVQRLEEREQQQKLAETTSLLCRISNKEKEHDDQKSGKKSQGEKSKEIRSYKVQSALAKSEDVCALAPLQSRGSPVDMWQARLRLLESRNACLQQQLGARLTGHRALVEDRKALQQQLHELHATAQREMRALERQHREAVKLLEDTHRRRTAAACHDAADAARRRETCARRGIAQVVAELMAFLRAFDAHAALIRSRNKSNNNNNSNAVCSHRCHNMAVTGVNCLFDEKEDALRDACDDIVRNLLGLDGGWEALQSCSSSSDIISSNNNHNKDSGMIPAEVLRRVQSFLLDHFEVCMLKKPTAAAAAAAGLSVCRESAGNKKRVSVCFVTPSDGDFNSKKDGNYDSDGSYDKLYLCSNEQPLVKLLMECVQYALP